MRLQAEYDKKAALTEQQLLYSEGHAKEQTARIEELQQELSACNQRLEEKNRQFVV